MPRFEVITPQEAYYSDIRFDGISVAGVGTSIVLPQYKLCFDMAQGLPHAFHMMNYFITHGHMDHAGGIPYIISQKGLVSQKGAKYYMPPNMIDPMERIIETWEGLEQHKYDYEFIGVDLDTYYEINPNFVVRAFPTVHRVPSNGYTLFEKKKKLKPEFQGKPKQEIVEARKKGIEFETIVYEPHVSFTGDTQIEFLDQCDWVKESKVLMMEVTYGGEKKSVESAREWGHTHLDELVPRLKDINCENIVLIHQSSRHSFKEFQSIVLNHVPASEQDRIHIFPRY